MSIVNRIFALLKERKIQQKDFAKEINVLPSVLSDWKSGRLHPTLMTITKIADYFGVSTDYLLGKTDNPNNTWLEKNAIPVGKMNKIPVYGRVSAGNGILAVEDIIDYEFTDDRYSTPDYFFLKVQGDSMSPQLYNGDLVLVKKQTSIDSGTVGVFLVDDEIGYIKKVIYDTNFVELISFNPQYPVISFNGKDVERVRVLGLVVESKRKW